MARLYRYVIVIILLFPITSFAQSILSKEEAEKFLTNGTSRSWILKGAKPVLGSCVGNDQSFNFYANGTADWKRCIHGKREYKRVTWSVSETPNAYGTCIIKFGDSLEIFDHVKVILLLVTFVKPKVLKADTKMTWTTVRRQKAKPGEILELVSRN